MQEPKPKKPLTKRQKEKAETERRRAHNEAVFYKSAVDDAEIKTGDVLRRHPPKDPKTREADSLKIRGDRLYAAARGDVDYSFQGRPSPVHPNAHRQLKEDARKSIERSIAVDPRYKKKAAPAPKKGKSK